MKEEVEVKFLYLLGVDTLSRVSRKEATFQPLGLESPSDDTCSVLVGAVEKHRGSGT